MIDYDWQWASTYLSKGRKKYERTLYDRGLRIWKTNKWDANSDISVGWAPSSSFVTYHKDSTTTIHGPAYKAGWPSLRSYSVRLTIMRYAGIQVLQRNFKFYLEEYDAPRTAPKIQGCRTCSQSGLVDSWCYSTTCYHGSKNSEGKMFCEEHPDAVYTGIQYQYIWHRTPCKHGQLDGHEVKKGIVCRTCQGTKKHDYGSKPERMLWSGAPLRLRDGKIIKSAATQLERMIADNVEFIIS